MKKLFTLLFALVAITSLWAEDFEVNGIYYKILTDKTNEVEVTYRGSSYSSYYFEYTGSVTIPSSVTYNGTTYSVTSIGYAAFEACSGLTSITIPNSVTSIGGDAFAYCSGLTSVTIPNSVTSIGDYAFYDCDGLTSITIPNSVTSIGDGAFRDCSGLTSVTIPNSVTSIGYAAFEACSSLTSITIPNSVTGIGDVAFYDCSALDTITCLAMTPPALGENVFVRYDNTTLLVPCKALSDYQAHEQWGQFTTIECISSEEAETEEVVIESGTTTIQKIMRNGQLLILRDGVEYNAIGQEL